MEFHLQVTNRVGGISEVVTHDMTKTRGPVLQVRRRFPMSLAMVIVVFAARAAIASLDRAS